VTLLGGAGTHMFHYTNVGACYMLIGLHPDSEEQYSPRSRCPVCLTTLLTVCRWILLAEWQQPVPVSRALDCTRCEGFVHEALVGR
jgi:hypothetical protein